MPAAAAVPKAADWRSALREMIMLRILLEAH
jgi:hypothetical protein